MFSDSESLSVTQIVQFSLEEIVEAVNGSNEELQLQATQATRYAEGAVVHPASRRHFFLVEEMPKWEGAQQPELP